MGGLGAGVAYLISNFGYSENYSQLADPSSNVTFTYTNNNRSQISAGNTAQNSISNVNNDRDDNDSNSNNNLNNTGNNTTINNNGRRKRSLQRIIEKFRKRHMTSIYERLIGEFQTLKNNTNSVT